MYVNTFVFSIFLIVLLYWSSLFIQLEVEGPLAPFLPLIHINLSPIAIYKKTSSMQIVPPSDFSGILNYLSHSVCTASSLLLSIPAVNG